MKKIELFALFFVLALALLLGACQSGGSEEPVLPVDDPYSEYDQEPSAPPTWRHGSGHDAQAYLEDIRAESTLGDIWWLNGETVDQVCGEDDWMDAAYRKGVFQFEFFLPLTEEEACALTGMDLEELQRRVDRWPWEFWGSLCQRWELCVTIQPIDGDDWPTPDQWIPPEHYSYEDIRERDVPAPGGDDMVNGWSPRNPQSTDEYKMPQFAPVKGHEGYEMAVVHALPDDTPLQVRLRWRNQEGFGFWAQLPAHDLDTFWEYQDQWFVPVNVTEGETS